MNTNTITLDGYYIPDDFNLSGNLDIKTTKLSSNLNINQLQITRPLLTGLCEHLAANQRKILSTIPISRIVHTLDTAARIWVEESQPQCAKVIEAIVALTGFSIQMVRESIRKEQLSSRSQDIWNALENEFGNPEVLDRFVLFPKNRAKTMAIGPELIFAILPGNIPGLSHLSYMRSLLVKSSCIGKTAGDEPVYAAAYARTIAAIDPEIGRCICVVNWKGGNDALENIAYEKSGAVIAYGSEKTCRQIASKAGFDKPVILHGHKLGFALLDHNVAANPEKAKELCRKLAYDVAMFDQQACLSPHWIFIEEKDESTTRFICAEIAQNLRLMEQMVPRGELSVEQSSDMARRWDESELAMLLGEDVEIFSNRTKDHFLLYIDRRPKLEPSCLGRCIRVIPVSSIDAALEMLRPLSGYFQNAAVEASQHSRICRELAQMGLTRICSPGNMPTPTMMWHHDGKCCLNQLVRFCDIEDSWNESVIKHSVLQNQV